VKHLKVESIGSPTLFEMGKLEKTTEVMGRLNIERPHSEPGLYLATSAFTANGWVGSFYPLSVASRVI
jgi:hypothetical protein